ncbi:DUF928 domain-containing protein [Leptolyngbya cf. ectocarpi LEGE 11479]|uniref:DUF928 domain-containing protein n=1 Tax=Leptolyngbya cf. ectocarpi LEGE 11479 TaxID=1828722 RepID=A0A928ZUX8_LEPEC|nr:DUF928 domain-containing protein [Leptolyngbya ectocarpi]MBE9067932.1 DUF928 domain-containing protein [Leptolyngbya cf. ectocarpi LEGE 11479]
MMTSLQHLRLISISIVIMGWLPGWAMAQVQAKSLAKADSEAATLSLVVAKNEDPADGFTGRGSPSRRSSGGSRGDCSALLVALVPGDTALAVSEAGCSLPSSSEPALTTAAMPVLWFHVPAHTAPTAGEFALLDDTQLALSVQTITLPQEGGIVGIQMDTELDIDRTYNWVFSLLVNPRKPADNPRVAGTLQRVNPGADVLSEINGAESLQQQAEIWLSQGIWHNALTTVATLRQSETEQTEQQWQDFLGSAGLEAIADAPLQDCCR